MRTPLDSSTQLCWLLDNTAAPCANSGVGGTLDLARYYGSPEYSASGPWGAGSTCIYFPGSTGLGTVDTSLGETATALTVSVWFYVQSSTDSNIISKESHLRGSSWSNPYVAWAICLKPDGQVRCLLTTGTGEGAYKEVYTGNARVGLKQWVFATLTYDGTTIRVYLNGRLVASDAPTSPGSINYAAHGPYTLGGFSYNTYNETSNMRISDARVENVVRTGEYLQQLFVDADISIGAPHAGEYLAIAPFSATPCRSHSGEYLDSSCFLSPPNRNRPGVLVGLGGGGGGAPAVVIKYKMRGYLYEVGTFEEWVTTDLTSHNPSGQPIRDVVIVDSF